MKSCHTPKSVPTITMNKWKGDEMKKNYKDFYGCTASITVARDGRAKLVMRTAGGKLIARGEYKTERGARIAMGRSSDGWRQI